MKHYDIAALGELLIDFTPTGKNAQGSQLYARCPGGAPANVLAMNTLLGGSTAFLGKVGKDAFGHYLKSILDQAGIATMGLVLDETYPTTLAFVNLDDRGDRSFSFYRSPGADLMLRPEEVERSIIDQADVFHFGSVSMTDEPCRGTVWETVKYARAAGKLVSFDPNYRPLLWKSKQEAVEQICAILPLVDVLKVSDEEMTLLTGQTDLETGSAMLAEHGPGIVIVTMGEKGAYFRCPQGTGHVEAYRAKTIDTTGAGDAFWGTVLYGLRGKGKEVISAMDPADWIAVLSFANAAGSLTTEAYGAIPAMPKSAEDIAAHQRVAARGSAE